MKDKKIVYVNYSPYENQVNILDFLVDEYRYVFLFSIGHYNLGKNQKTNKITVYENKKIIKNINFFYLHTSNKFVFTILPLKSFLNFIQIIFQCMRLKKEFGNLDIYFTVNGYTAWIGLVLKKIGLVSKTIYWVCDYYPIFHKSKVVQLMRWLYWQFEKKTIASDVLTFHNTRIVDVWKKNNLLPENYQPILVPAGTAKSISLVRKDTKIVRLFFLGVLKRSMGIDFILDSAYALSKNFPGIIVEIVGPGPDSEYFKRRAKNLPIKFNFYGYLDEDKLDKIILKSTIGIAPYMPDPSHVAYYADSAKMKKYISFGLPIITTRVHELSEEIEKSKAGILVEYGSSGELVQAIKKINKNYDNMLVNVVKLNNRYYYKNIYYKMFESVT